MPGDTHKPRQRMILINVRPARRFLPAQPCARQRVL